jgi:hypothetical protein
MRTVPDEGRQRVITEVLGEDSALLPFAEAVVHHLTRFRDRAEASVIAAKVAKVLADTRDPEKAMPVDALRDWPELLASFFQNADLLPTGAPEGARVARLVMSAVESLDTGT